MKAVGLWVWQGLLLSALLQKCHARDEDCVTPSASHSVITHADLKDSASQMLYRCYRVPRPSMMLVVLQCLNLHNQGAMRLYTDGFAVEITKDCCTSKKHGSESDNMIASEETPTECGVVRNATDIVEIYLRDDRPQESCDYEDKNCAEELEFEINISVVKKTSCKNAIFPLDFDACYLNTSLSTISEECLRVTCTDDNVIAPDETMEYTVPVGPNTCIWQLDTSQQKHLKLAFTPSIQKYITVFEGSLFNPKWSLAGCASMQLLNLNAEADVVYIVYHNGQPEDAEGSLVITHQSDPCLLPPVIDHGNVEFERFDAKTVAHYTCNQGYELIGEAALTCREGQWAQAPTCVAFTKEKQVMADAPVDEKITGVEDNDTVVSINSSLVPSLMPPEKEVTDTYDSPLIISAEEGSGSEGDFDYTTQDYGDTVYKDSEISSSYDDYGNEFIHKGNHSESESEVSMDDEIWMNANSSNIDTTPTLADLLNLKIKDPFTLYIIIGSTGLLFIIILITITILIYRKKFPVRLGLGRKFDTFQNPIYEKTLVQVPMRSEVGGTREVEGGDWEDKQDPEGVSDSTVLE
ncbi:uncharacterized protein LOC143033096 isoform X2 [Oratosquilla oratoria]|uniref:uncharacterized protein LOC143033096 isoform X2 n=1 Tax=Oratosquilla oratoria TaxID=337810 RepID=UPI003F76E4B1